MRRAADLHGLAVVTEVLSEADVALVADYAEPHDSSRITEYAKLRPF